MGLRRLFLIVLVGIVVALVARAKAVEREPEPVAGRYPAVTEFIR